MFGGVFDIEKKLARIAEINDLETLDGFWEDRDNASKVQKEKSFLENTVKSFDHLNGLFEEYEILKEYAEEGDKDSCQEALSVFEKISELLPIEEQKAMLSGELDGNNAIVSVNAGAGGTESCDWASMLTRMLHRWCDTRGFKVQVYDVQAGDSAGIKSTSFLVEGDFAYGLLKSEIGIHRLVRISPFDSNARRHTSFASIFVGPEIDDQIEIEVQDKDIKIDVYRSGGAGGQSVNTTDSAVRITHGPSGIVVTCQNERSQLQNKQTAMKILKSRLYELALKEKQAEQDKIEANKKEIGWGSQIRSYVLHPYKMVKDHRTNFEMGSAEKVLDGELDPFIKSYLQWNSLQDEK
jgi:peptide chain release factor 2